MAILVGVNVRACCPDCGGAITTFESKTANGGAFHGLILAQGDQRTHGYVLYLLLKCAGCGRAGLAKILSNNSNSVADPSSRLAWFFPVSPGSTVLPQSTPDGIRLEFNEASTCLSFGAYRAASALYRSCIEKVLKDNGYTDGNMMKKIELAASEGAITESRKRRANDEIRSLGNDVLHDEWRKVEEAEAIMAQEYSQRIIEDFYDHRETVVNLLKEKGRFK
jgi:Domain of unknown function (DUF4145)